MEEDKELRRLSMKLGSALNKYGFVNDYWITLENMSENYDFILEDIDPGAFTGWSDDKITEKASEMLRVTGELFEKMLEDCERDLLDAVAGIAALGEERQSWCGRIRFRGRNWWIWMRRRYICG